MKTYSIKPKDINRSWYLLDASEAPLGRLSSEAAKLLLGKGKAAFSLHIDNGDHVVVINAEHLLTTGDKTQKKTYWRHSGYAGGISKRTLAEQMQKDPKKVVQKAVRGMLPPNKLRDQRLKRLKVYLASEHQHQSQKPQKINLLKGRKVHDGSK
jgi:large subunit ribosomal protein L13